MRSMREKLWPGGNFGFPSVQGSIRMTSPEGRRNWNVPCPSQVISIQDHSTAGSGGKEPRHVDLWEDLRTPRRVPGSREERQWPATECRRHTSRFRE